MSITDLKRHSKSAPPTPTFRVRASGELTFEVDARPQSQAQTDARRPTIDDRVFAQSAANSNTSRPQPQFSPGRHMTGRSDDGHRLGGIRVGRDGHLVHDAWTPRRESDACAGLPREDQRFFVGTGLGCERRLADVAKNRADANVADRCDGAHIEVAMCFSRAHQLQRRCNDEMVADRLPDGRAELTKMALILSARPVWYCRGIGLHLTDGQAVIAETQARKSEGECLRACLRRLAGTVVLQQHVEV